MALGVPAAKKPRRECHFDPPWSEEFPGIQSRGNTLNFLVLVTCNAHQWKAAPVCISFDYRARGRSWKCP